VVQLLLRPTDTAQHRPASLGLRRTLGRSEAASTSAVRSSVASKVPWGWEELLATPREVRRRPGCTPCTPWASGATSCFRAATLRRVAGSANGRGLMTDIADPGTAASASLRGWQGRVPPRSTACAVCERLAPRRRGLLRCAHCHLLPRQRAYRTTTATLGARAADFLHSLATVCHQRARWGTICVGNCSARLADRQTAQAGEAAMQRGGRGGSRAAGQRDGGRFAHTWRRGGADSAVAAPVAAPAPAPVLAHARTPSSRTWSRDASTGAATRAAAPSLPSASPGKRYAKPKPHTLVRAASLAAARQPPPARLAPRAAGARRGGGAWRRQPESGAAAREPRGAQSSQGGASALRAAHGGGVRRAGAAASGASLTWTRGRKPLLRAAAPSASAVGRAAAGGVKRARAASGVGPPRKRLRAASGSAPAKGGSRGALVLRPLCLSFCRTGRCRKPPGACLLRHDADKVAVCVRWLSNACSDACCPLTHRVRHSAAAAQHLSIAHPPHLSRRHAGHPGAHACVHVLSGGAVRGACVPLPPRSGEPLRPNLPVVSRGLLPQRCHVPAASHAHLPGRGCGRELPKPGSLPPQPPAAAPGGCGGTTRSCGAAPQERAARLCP